MENFGSRKKRKITNNKKKTFFPPPKKSIFSNYATNFHKVQVKTVDMTFNAAVVRPYVPDLLAPTGIVMNTTGTIQNLAAIQQGTAESQRVGNKVALKSLRLRLRLRNSGFLTDQISAGRVMVIYDRQPNGVYPAISTILSTVNQAGTIIAGTLDSSINVNLLERFIVVMDKYLALQPSNNALQPYNTGSTDQRNFQIDEFLKLKNLETAFSDTVSPMTIAQVPTGALYLICLGNIVSGSEPFYWQGEVRLRFRDV